MIYVSEELPHDYTIALEEARRGADQLLGEVDVIRNRAVSVLGMAGLAASFIGGLHLENNVKLSGWTWLTVGSFAFLAAVCMTILLPRRLHFSQDPQVLVEWSEVHGADINQMHRDLALWMGAKYDQNRMKVDNLGRLFVLASLAFSVEVASLVIDLSMR